jgi:hypothetical protein
MVLMDHKKYVSKQTIKDQNLHISILLFIDILKNLFKVSLEKYFIYQKFQKILGKH